MPTGMFCGRKLCNNENACSATVELDYIFSHHHARTLTCYAGIIISPVLDYTYCAHDYASIVCTSLTIIFFFLQNQVNFVLIWTILRIHELLHINVFS